MYFFLFLFLTKISFGLDLQFLSYQEIPNGLNFQKTTVGGLSAITFDPNLKKFLLLSDDRSTLNPARWYEFSFTFTKGILLAPLSVTFLKQTNQIPHAKGTIDPEGIALCISGSIFISSEGDQTQNPRIAPFVRMMGSDGSFKKDLPIPEKFLAEPTGTQRKGVRNNLAFEGLSCAPSGKYLYVGTESGLMQDDTPADDKKGSNVRIIRYDLSTFKSDKEFIYPVSPLPNAKTSSEADNGLSDLLALDDQNLIVVERSYNQRLSKNFIKLFSVSLENGQDVSSLTSIKNTSVQPLKKTPVLDFENLVPLIHSSKPHVDNIEGITFGPILTDGTKTLILVSDDNFSKSQKTQIWTLKIK